MEQNFLGSWKSKRNHNWMKLCWNACVLRLHRLFIHHDHNNVNQRKGITSKTFYSCIVYTIHIFEKSVFNFKLSTFSSLCFLFWYFVMCWHWRYDKLHVWLFDFFKNLKLHIFFLPKYESFTYTHTQMKVLHLILFEMTVSLLWIFPQ